MDAKAEVEESSSDQTVRRPFRGKAELSEEGIYGHFTLDELLG